MARIRVTETFRHRPNQGTCIVYRPGTYNAPTAAATLAVASGKAMRMTKARKDEEPVEEPRWLTGDEAIAASREWLSLKAGQSGVDGKSLSVVEISAKEGDVDH